MPDYQSFASQLDPMASFRAAEKSVDDAFTTQSRRAAGRAYAGGDRQGAANLLARRGDIQSARTIEGDIRGDQQVGQAAKVKEAEQKATYLLNVTQALRQIPFERRNEAFASLKEALAQIVPPEALAQMESADKSDQALDAFATSLGQEVQKLQLFNTKAGVVAADPRTGDATLAYDAPDDPDAELKRQLLEAQIASTRSLGGQRDASAARARRPASGSGGGARSAAPSSNRGPWEDYR